MPMDDKNPMGKMGGMGKMGKGDEKMGGPKGPPDDMKPMMDVMIAVDTENGAASDAMAPEPDMPYTMGALKALGDALASVVKEVPDFDYAPWTPDKKMVQGNTWSGPLPSELWRPLLAFAEAVKAVNTDNAFDKYIFEATEVMNDGLLREAVGKIMAAVKDPEFMAIMKEGPEAPTGEVEEETPEKMAEMYA